MIYTNYASAETRVSVSDLELWDQASFFPSSHFPHFNHVSCAMWQTVQRPPPPSLQQGSSRLLAGGGHLLILWHHAVPYLLGGFISFWAPVMIVMNPPSRFLTKNLSCTIFGHTIQNPAFVERASIFYFSRPTVRVRTLLAQSNPPKKGSPKDGMLSFLLKHCVYLRRSFCHSRRYVVSPAYPGKCPLWHGRPVPGGPVSPFHVHLRPLGKVGEDLSAGRCGFSNKRKPECEHAAPGMRGHYNPPAGAEGANRNEPPKLGKCGSFHSCHPNAPSFEFSHEHIHCMTSA